MISFFSIIKDYLQYFVFIQSTSRSLNECLHCRRVVSGDKKYKHIETYLTHQINDTDVFLLQS